jgi:cytoskeleton protein RodZ
VNESVPESVDEAPAARPVQLGLLLRKAREARGLSIDDVVQVLKFRARQIESLEADAIPVVAGDVFTRGIVRSYARFLKLDPEPLLALLEAESPLALPEVRAPDNMGTAMPDGVWRRLPPLVLVSLILLAIAGALAAWHFLVPEVMPKLSTGTAAQVVDEPVLPAPTPHGGAEASLAAGQMVAGSGDGSPVQAAPTAAATVVAADPAAAQPLPATAATGTVPVVLPEGSKKLMFDFRGKSWVEVKDTNQRVLFTGQYFAGNHETLSAKPPLQLVIGNAADVQVEFDGRVIDLKPYTRAEVARFTLE